MKIMLINSIIKEEVRIAILDNNKLCELNIENNINKKSKFNIYKGKIVKFEKSLAAFFVNYGVERNGFLPIKEIYNFHTKNDCYYVNRVKVKKKKIKVGICVLVQISKEETINKGAFLTTYISLPGIYSVLMPYNINKEGISKKITGIDRAKIKKFVSLLNIPKNMGFIIRTASIKASIRAIQKDIDDKVKLWKYIKNKYKKIKYPKLVYKESDIIINTFRDFLYKDVDEIVVDNPKILDKIYNYFFYTSDISFFKKIKIYNKKIPLFSFYKIESQIRTLFNRKIILQSGGSITIDSTEALTAIDINSFKSKKCNSIEDTAFNTNMEAINEIFRQIRIRDVGGLIVIDLIDMEFSNNKKILKNRLNKLVKQDRARIEIGEISKFGLLEMSRQRINSILKEHSYYFCSKCDGHGFLVDKKSLSRSILRLLEEELFKYNVYQVNIILPVKICSYLYKKKMDCINNIKKRYLDKKIVIFFSKKIKSPNFLIFSLCKNKKKNLILKKLIKEYNANSIV
ncbi:Rne/Rng family ribonuclease [Buchnera aphidicola (Chaitoregma tattakana)]|uniref:Rne/Rng family ribonuclease n=1 Tax=Buchnera aphidicola TaxID=9 RepID=UPI0031B8AD9B